MLITFITDTASPNAQGRVSTRIANLFNITPTFIGVTSRIVGQGSDIMAAGNLLDILDVAGDSQGFILVNVAPRTPKSKWENGTPFGYFVYKNLIVISTVDGFTLSLVKKLNLCAQIQLFDIPVVTKFMAEHGSISGVEAEFITHSQFRSLEFLPKVAFWLSQGYKLPTTDYSLDNVSDVKSTIWYIDSFGNCKTTIFRDEWEELQPKLNSKLRNLPLIKRFADVPTGTLSWIQGSSGFESRRFLEIVLQRGSSYKELGLKVGESLAV